MEKSVIYRRYKTDGHIFISWCMETQIELLDGRPMQKTAKNAALSPVIKTIGEIAGAVDHICSSDPKLLVPWNVVRALKGCINGRTRLADIFNKMGSECEGHLYFLSSLKSWSSQLEESCLIQEKPDKPAEAKPETTEKNNENFYGVLSSPDKSPSISSDSDAEETPAVPDEDVYKPQRIYDIYRDPSEDLKLEWLCLQDDTNYFVDYVKDMWLRYETRQVSLHTVTLVIEAAAQSLMAEEKQLRKRAGRDSYFLNLDDVPGLPSNPNYRSLHRVKESLFFRYPRHRDRVPEGDINLTDYFQELEHYLGAFKKQEDNEDASSYRFFQSCLDPITRILGEILDYEKPLLLIHVKLADILQHIQKSKDANAYMTDLSKLLESYGHLDLEAKMFCSVEIEPKGKAEDKESPLGLRRGIPESERHLKGVPPTVIQAKAPKWQKKNTNKKVIRAAIKESLKKKKEVEAPEPKKEPPEGKLVFPLLPDYHLASELRSWATWNTESTTETFKRNPLLSGKLVLNLRVFYHHYSFNHINSNNELFFFCYIYLMGHQYRFLKSKWSALDEVMLLLKKNFFAGELPPDVDTAFNRLLLQMGYGLNFAAAVARWSAGESSKKESDKLFDKGERIKARKRRWLFAVSPLMCALLGHAYGSLDISCMLGDGVTTSSLQALESRMEHLAKEWKPDYCGILANVKSVYDEILKNRPNAIYVGLSSIVQFPTGEPISDTALGILAEISDRERWMKIEKRVIETPLCDVAFRIIEEHVQLINGFRPKRPRPPIAAESQREANEGIGRQSAIPQKGSAHHMAAIESGNEEEEIPQKGLAHHVVPIESGDKDEESPQKGLAHHVLTVESVDEEKYLPQKGPAHRVVAIESEDEEEHVPQKRPSYRYAPTVESADEEEKSPPKGPVHMMITSQSEDEEGEEPPIFHFSVREVHG